MPLSPESAFVVCRFVHFLALMLLFGESAFLAFLAPPTLRRSLQRDGHFLLLLSAGIVAVSALIMVPIEAAQMGNGWQDAPHLDAWQAVLQTAFGNVWRWHLALSIGALLLTIAAAGSTHKVHIDRPKHWPMILLALASATLLASLGLVGHAAMHDGWRGALQRLNHGAHLLSAGAWFGALPAVIGCLRRLMHLPNSVADSGNSSDRTDRNDDSVARDAIRAVRRFSTMGHIAVVVVILTGIVNTAWVLKAWPIHVDRPYERMLDIKIALVAIMTGVAVYNRYCWVPALKAHPEKALAALKRNTYIEIALGCAVLLLVATFATDDPQ